MTREQRLVRIERQVAKYYKQLKELLKEKGIK